MGSFKETGKKGVENIKEQGKNAVDTGEKMTQEAGSIKSILDNINVQDSDDVNAVAQGEAGYSSSFDAAFGEQVDTKNQEVGSKGQEISQEISGELTSVEAGIGSLEQASGISEIGKENAETAKTQLEGSAREYEGIISEADQTVSDTDAQVQNLKNNLGSIFG